MEKRRKKFLKQNQKQNLKLRKRVKENKMTYSIKCTISLSKKLRFVLGENTKLHLSTIQLNNGVGQAYLIIDSDIDPDILLNSETSIMITPIEIKASDDV